MNIRPALFIGLGSTGVKIINDFRRLMFEQFSKAGLPIFAYIGMETDGAFTVSDKNLPDEYSLEPYEKIHMVPLTINSKKSVEPLYDEKSPSFTPDLTRWLDTSILKGSFAIKGGAGNVRLFGRLALWNNWPSVKAELQAQHADIRTGKAIADTLNILTAKFPGVKTPHQVKSGYDIYMLGTLCGGTCSGSILDMAFQIKNLFGVGELFGQEDQDPRFHAILTILDNVLAGAQGHKPNSANCWAALKELDYYMDEETFYDYTMPGDPPIRKTYDPPLSCIYLVGRTNMIGTFFPGAPGAFDDSQINKMVALKLFNNSFLDLGSPIAARVVNQAALTGEGIKERNTYLHERCMVSFGVSCLWYPKYKVAEVFSLKQAGNFCRALVEEANPARQFVLKNMVKDIWEQVWDGVQDLAVKAPGVGKANIIVRNALEKLDGFAQNVDGPNLVAYLKNYPEGADGPLGIRLSEGGDIWNQISAMSVQADAFVRQELEKWIAEKLGTIGYLDPAVGKDERAIQNYAEMRWLLEKLRDHLAPMAAKGNAGKGDFIFKPPYTPNDLRKPEPSIMDRLTGKDKQMMEEYDNKRRGVIENYKKVIGDHLKRIIQLTAQPKLDMWIQNVLNNDIKKIDKIIMKLNDIASELDASRQDVQRADSNHSENMLEIGMKGAGKLEFRVDELKQLFENQPDPDRMLVIQKILEDWQEGGNDKTWPDLFMQDNEIVANRIKTPFFRWALDTKSVIKADLVSIAQNEFSDNKLPLEQHLKKSYPYVVMHAGYVKPPAFAASMIDLLMGPENVTSFKGFIDRQVPNYALAVPGISPLETLISFYREEPPFTIDDLAAKGFFETAYIQADQKGAGLHTHKNGAKEFDKSGIFEYRKVKMDYDIIQWLYPNEAFIEAVPGKGVWVLQYYNPDARRISTKIAYDAHDPKIEGKFCHELAQTDGAYARESFRENILKVLRLRTRDEVGDLWESLKMSWIADRVEDSDLHKRDEAFGVLLDKAFPETTAQSSSNRKPLRSV